MNVDSSIIHNNPKLETTQRPIPVEWIQRYICKMEFRQWKIHSMKKSTLLLQMQLDESHSYVAVWKKPDIKEDLL